MQFFLLKHFQGKNIENHINSGGGFFGWSRIIGGGFIGLAVILVTIFSVVFLTDTSAANETSKSYGALKHMITFDKNNISANEVDQLAHHLTEITFFDQEITKYVYAEKLNNTYELNISVGDGIQNDNEALQSFADLRTEIQTFYPNEKIILKLVVDNLDNVVKKLE